MSMKSVVAAFAVLGLAGFAAWMALSGGEEDPRGPAPAKGTKAAAAAPDAAQPDLKRKARATGRKWALLGTGEVAGSVREYGSERPLGDVEVSIEPPADAGATGPDRTLRARTAADGTFRLRDVPNYENWTIRVDVSEPLADVEAQGVTVTENKVTDLGILYVTPAFTVPGVVVDAKGDPVEGAEVRMIRATGAVSQMDILRLIREIAVDPPSVDRATSGKDGRFALAKASPGVYDVKAVARGRRVTLVNGVVVTPDAAKHPLRIVMEEGYAIEGRVVRKGPGNVEGIAVAAFAQPRGEASFLVLDRLVAHTDKDGKFAIEGLAPGRHIVAAAPEGEPIKIADDVDVPARGPVEILLEGDAWAEGTITGNGGLPVPDAMVYVASFDDNPVVGTARTGADGKYVIRGLKSGPIQLFLVQAAGYATFPTDLMSMLQGGRGKQQTLAPGRNQLDASLVQGGTVRGVVTVQGAETGLEGVRVELVTPLALFGGSRGTTTGPDGRFELTSVPLGESFLVCSKDGWFQPGVNPLTLLMGMGGMGRGGAQKKAPPDAGKGARISIVEPGAAVERTFEMSRGSVLRGVVTAPDGTPVSGARVQLVAEMPPQMRGMGEALSYAFSTGDPKLTDGEGRFELSGPPEGQKGRVSARAQGWLDGRSDPLGAKSGEVVEGLSVRLRAGATLEGEVKDDAGRPLSGAFVRWVKVEDGDDWSVQWRLRQASPTTTGDDGRFVVSTVETGKIAVEVTHPRHLPHRMPDTVTEEAKTAKLDVALRAAAEISGKVLGLDGKPVAGAHIELSRQVPADRDVPWTDRSSDAVTGADGTFRAEGLFQDDYELVASLDGFAPSEPVRAGPGTSGHVLRLAQAFRIAGVVRCEGRAVSNASVTLVRLRESRDPSGAELRTEDQVDSERTDAEGRFAFDQVAGGSYRVNVGGGWWGEDRPNVRPKTVDGIVAGNEGVVIEMDAGLSIAGRVVLPDGTNAPAGQVHANRIFQVGEQPAPNEQTWANAGLADGSFELVGLAPGTWQVTVQVPGFATWSQQAPAGRKDLSITLAAGGTVTGRLLDPDGKPVQGAWVQAEGGGANGMSDADGRFKIEGVAVGTAKLVARRWAAPRLVGAAENVEVRAGSATDVGDVQMALETQSTPR